MTLYINTFNIIACKMWLEIKLIFRSCSRLCKHWSWWFIVKYVRGLSEVKMWNMYYSESFKINVSKMICFKILLLLFVINFVEAGRRLIGFNFKAVSPTGYQQCLKLCIGHADCFSVNFSRNQLQCELNSQHETDTVRVTENTEETEDFIYISKTSFPNVSFKGWGG